MNAHAVRRPAVAGLFYPAEPARLRAAVDALLRAAGTAPEAPRPRALVAPHAGYVYSGAAAARAYARLPPWRDAIRRVVVAGPPHRVPVRGVASSAAAAFATPLGELALDRDAVTAVEAAGARPDDHAHAPEHALEVQLPFLQATLGAVEVVPLLIGDIAPARVAELLAPWWARDDTLLVISTDLSHFLDYGTAQRRDADTDRAIMALDDGRIGPQDACGCRALNGLLHLAAQRGATIERLALCNSGDTAGDRARVVGYASYALH